MSNGIENREEIVSTVAGYQAFLVINQRGMDDLSTDKLKEQESDDLYEVGAPGAYENYTNSANTVLEFWYDQITVDPEDAIVEKLIEISNNQASAKVTESITIGNKNYYILDLISFTETFELNTVPTCVCNVPVGVDVERLVNTPGSTNSILATCIPTLVDKQPMCKIFLRKKVTEIASTGPHKDVCAVVSREWTSFQCVFEGYLTQVNTKKTGDSAYSMAITLSHWLMDLGLSPCLSGSVAPGSARDATKCVFNYSLLAPSTNNDSYNNPTGDNGMYDIQNNNMWTDITNIAAICSQGKFADPNVQLLNNDVPVRDFLVYPVINILKNTDCASKAIVTQRNISKNDNNPQFFSRNFVQQALDRIVIFDPEVFNDTDREWDPQQKYRVRPLVIPPQNVQELDTALINTIGQSITLETLANSSIWDLLLEYSSQLMFTIVPTPKYLYCVPYEPCADKSFLTLENVALLDIFTVLNRPIGCSLAFLDNSCNNVMHMINDDISNLNIDKTNPEFFGGSFIPTRTDSNPTKASQSSNTSSMNIIDGMILASKIPPMFSNLYSSWLHCNDNAARALSTGDTTYSTAEQDADDDPSPRQQELLDDDPTGESQRSEDVAAINGCRNLYDKLAEIYYYKAKSQCQCITVQCPLTFEIAPSTQIRVKLQGNFGSTQEEKDNQNITYQGSVVSVTNEVNTLAQTAATSLKLVATRIVTDDKPLYSTNKHALYNNIDGHDMYIGLKLVNGGTGWNQL